MRRLLSLCLVVALASACGGGDGGSSTPQPSAANSSLAVAPTTAAANGTATVTATATILDAANAPISGATVVFAATGTGNTWTPTSAVTNGSGVATAALSSTAAGAKTVSVTASGVAITQTQVVTFKGVPSASNSTVAVSASTAIANGTTAVTVTATIKDAAGTAVDGATVAFAATGTSNTLTPATAVTNASGVATSALTSTAAGAKVVSVTADGVAVAQTQTVTFTASNLNDLVISEVGNWYYSNVPAWLEIYNGTAASVDLSAYTVRAGGTNPAGGALLGPTLFALPALVVPSGAYVVIAGKTVANSDFDGPRYVHVAAAGLVPYWSPGSGFVELLKAGATVDFVRFGTSSTTPITASMWSGAGAEAFPSGSTQYNSALARRPITASTHTAADWQQVRFPTPGGPNDVAPGAVDSDGDGIPDSAKVAGGTYAGLDLYGMGARPGHKDVFIELDAMESTDPGVIPLSTALDPVVAKFQAHGVYLHIDAGARYSATFNPALYNLGQAIWSVPFANCMTFPPEAGCSGNLFTYKGRYMDVARRSIFHYALFASSQETTGARGSSGLGNVVGPNFIVTLGNWGLTTTPGPALNKLVNYQAATFMHEFGHNLGLRHGGYENQNYKPNYFSIMNYLYQLNGLSNVAASTVGDRYLFENFNKPALICDLEASPCSPVGTFRMDFSNGTSADLNQSNVLESVGIGRSTPNNWIDFNDNGVMNDGYAKILNPKNDEDPPSSITAVLKDYDDWSNLRLPFQSGTSWLYGGASPRALVESWSPVAPFSDATLEVAREWAPTPRFFDAIHQDAVR